MIRVRAIADTFPPHRAIAGLTDERFVDYDSARWALPRGLRKLRDRDADPAEILARFRGAQLPGGRLTYVIERESDEGGAS